MHLARIRLAAAAAFAGALVVGGLVVTPAASAAITASSITTPTDLTFLIADNSASAQTFAVSGTTSGGNPATDKVDIRCYHGTTSDLVVGDVGLNSDGSFSLPTANLHTLEDGPCRLRAVPAGTTPSNLTPFAGPRVGVGEFDKYRVSGGPNDGRLYSAYIWAQQLTGAFDWTTAGGDAGGFWGPVYDGYLYDPTFALTTFTFYGNAGLNAREKPSPTRSELQIDSKNAYFPASAAHINPNATGLPALTYTYTLDAATGNLVIHESDPLVVCPDSTYPPTTTSCASFVSAGVTDNVTMTQDHDGHIAWVSEAFTSTDGKAHSLDLLWENSQRFYSSSGDGTQVEYEFPGQSSFSLHAAGDAVPLPSSSPGTILVRVRGAADGDMSSGQGAIVYDRPATGAVFTDVGTSYSRFTLHQTGTVPAAGSTRFQFAYVQDYHAATVASLAQSASTGLLNTISVHKFGKGKGKVTSAPGGIVCGKACTHGYAYGTSVTLKAKPAKGSRFARWSGACTGRASCTITATANVTVNAKFTLKPCVVPNVVGKSLKKAKRAIKKSFCSVGKVTTVASTKPKGTVISQKPRKGKRLKRHAKVNLTVSKG